jgi:hypothetical protein
MNKNENNLIKNNSAVLFKDEVLVKTENHDFGNCMLIVTTL